MNIDKDLKSQIFFLSKCKGDLHNVFIENLDKNSESICAVRAMAEKMSADELKNLSKFMRYLKKWITQMNSFHSNAMYKHVTEAGSSTIQELKSMTDAGSRTGELDNFLEWQQIRKSRPLHWNMIR